MTKRIWVRHSAFDSARRVVQNMGLPYEIRQTSSSQGIRNKLYNIRTSNLYLGRGILGHLVSCKCEILKNAKTKNLLVSERLKWYKISEFFAEPEQQPRRMFVSEFDLNHAYWVVAFRLGFISEKTYKKFLTFKTKHFRLIALGMLAKREFLRKFDEHGNLIESKMTRDEIGTLIFRKIAYEVTSEMERLSKLNEDSFRFYWFDNIVFDTTIRKLETSYTYKFRTETLQLLFLRNRRLLLKLGNRDFAFPRIDIDPGRSKFSQGVALQDSTRFWKSQLQEQPF